MKRAKWALDSTRLNRDADHHGLCLLRSRFLYVVNGLHACFVDFIEAAHGAFWANAASNGGGIDDFLVAFWKFLHRVEHICLLDNATLPAQGPMSDAIGGLFDLCLRFQAAAVVTTKEESSSMLSEARICAGERGVD